MFDNLRDEPSPTFESESENLFPKEETPDITLPPAQTSERKLLGMTAIQRFIIALMLMIATCTLGTMCLLLTGKISLF